MLNRTKEEAIQFILESKGKISQKEMAFSLGVTQARISQMIKEMKGKEPQEQGPEAA